MKRVHLLSSDVPLLLDAPLHVAPSLDDLVTFFLRHLGCFIVSLCNARCDDVILYTLSLALDHFLVKSLHSIAGHRPSTTHDPEWNAHNTASNSLDKANTTFLFGAFIRIRNDAGYTV